ncbi:hypothetical protein FKW77_005577 [Venturia effusa]|uniref:Uncharacterized protein n=1 Tax=Venturia effusa TaxID=50376 RepID=A0A517L1E7_9PEZI|nr:hypothetical protein FKW77_005577 [Venturia effusa]
MCSRSFRRSAELRRHASTEHRDALERIARLEKALERLSGNKSEFPSPPSSTSERTASPEPTHHSSGEEIQLDSATINAQFLLVDRAVNDVLIRLDYLERAQKMDEDRLRRPTGEKECSRCRCGTPMEKIIERRARTLAQRIERGPQESRQHSVSQESRITALEMTLDRMTAGLRVALGRNTSEKVEIRQPSPTGGVPAWNRLAVGAGDVEESRASPDEEEQNSQSRSRDAHNRPAWQTLQCEGLEEQMDIDSTYGPSLWDRRPESMSEEVIRVAARGLSAPVRTGGASDVTPGNVELDPPRTSGEAVQV